MDGGRRKYFIVCFSLFFFLMLDNWHKMFSIWQLISFSTINKPICKPHTHTHTAMVFTLLTVVKLHSLQKLSNCGTKQTRKALEESLVLVLSTCLKVGVLFSFYLKIDGTHSKRTYTEIYSGFITKYSH